MPFNYLQTTTDIAALAVLWRVQDKLSPRNVAKMFFTSGFTFTHVTVPAGRSASRPCSPRG